MNRKLFVIGLLLLTSLLASCGDIVIEIPSDPGGGTNPNPNTGTGSENNPPNNPTDETRLIIITGEGRLTDDEVFSDEHSTLVINERTTLSLANPRYTFPAFIECAGGEVRVEMAITATLAPDYSVDVNGAAELYEGSSCNTTDSEDSTTLTGNVPAGQSGEWNFTLQNRGTGGGDKAEISFRIDNYRP